MCIRSVCLARQSQQPLNRDMHITVCRCFWDSRQQGVNSVRTVKCTLKEFEEMSKISNTSLKVRIWSFLKTATCFFASLATAPLFHTHQSRRVVAAFWLSVLASVFAPDFQLFLTLTTTFCHFDIATMRPQVPLKR